MEYIATTKVSGGKLLRVKAETEGSEPKMIVTSVSLTGDFFMHPEDGIIELEKCLAGMPARTEVRTYVSKLNDVIHGNGYELIGFSASDIAQTLYDALHPESEY